MLGRFIRRFGGAAALVALVFAVVGAIAASATTTTSYSVTNLVSDQEGKALTRDTSLVNGWGLAALPTSPWWVSDNGTDVSTLYRADGSKVPLTVGVRAAPTGLVANPGTSFAVSHGTASAPALFVFSTETGKIRGWNPGVAATESLVAADRSKDGAVYKGLAIALTTSGDWLYAADFHNGRVDVFNGSFQRVPAAGAFVDRDLPKGYAPFGIQNIGGAIFVTYAKQDEARKDEIAGEGLGFVDMYDTSGKLLGRVASRGRLNAPWGLAMAPASFGQFGGDLLVGNFGDGTINAFKLTDGKFVPDGQLMTNDHALVIDGLWAIEFGLGAANNGPTSTLFFTAGPDDEAHGLFGTITVG